MRMLDRLDEMVRRLPELLAAPNRHLWRSVHVTYHPPRVERLWIQLEDHRLFLHRIHPCEESDALFHPHPWPSAVRVVSGQYEHRVGWRRSNDTNLVETWRVATTSVLGAGSTYEMVEPEAWHSVRPLEAPSDSIMVVGPLYEPRVKMPNAPTEKQGPLSARRFDALMGQWHDRIDRPVKCYGCGWTGRHSELECYRDEHGAPVEVEHVRCPECLDEDQVGTR